MSSHDGPATKLAWHQFRLQTLLLLVVVTSLLSASSVAIYHWLNRQPTYKLVLHCPGAGPAACHTMLDWQISGALMRADMIADWTIVYYDERVEIFVTSLPRIDDEEFLQQFSTIVDNLQHLPFDVSMDPIELIANSPTQPKVVIENVNAYEADFDRELLFQLGMSYADFLPVFEKFTPESNNLTDALPELQNAQVRTPSGHTVVVGDIAEIKIVQRPSAIVHRRP